MKFDSRAKKKKLRGGAGKQKKKKYSRGDPGPGGAEIERKKADVGKEFSNPKVQKSVESGEDRTH